MKKVLLFGTFNILHPGHLNMFRQAKNYGDELYIVLARDDTIRDLKEYEPLNEIKRRETLLQLPMIDNVVFGDLDDKLKAVKEIQPDIICLGYDQFHFVNELEAYLFENNLDIPVIRLKSYFPDKYKSSKLK
jgi:FAD synthetase